MKRICSIILICFLALQAGILSIQFSNQKIQEVSKINQSSGNRFYLPKASETGNTNDDMMDALMKASKQYNANVFRTTITQTSSGRTNLVNYSMVQGDSKCFDKWKEAETWNRYYKNQLHVKLEDMSEIVDAIPAGGTYYVELKNKDDIEGYKKVLCKEINKKSKKNLAPKITTLKNLESGDDAVTLPIMDETIFIEANLFFIGLFFLLFLYYLYRSAKETAILRIFGYGKRKAVLFLQSYFYKLYLGLMLIETLLMILLQKRQEYILFLIKYMGIGFLAFFFITMLIGIGLVKGCRVRDELKGKDRTLIITMVNMGIKVLATVFLILFIAGVFHQYGTIRSKQKMYQGWDQSSNYGVFDAWCNGNDSGEEGERETEITVRRDLYPKLNQMGAILINAASYEKQQVEDEQNQEWKGYNDCKVNPNYLKKYALYDTKGQRISISEKESDWILLVPEKYKQEEKKIRKYYLEDRASMKKDADIDYYKIQPSKKVMEQKLKIVWMKNNQSIFSFHPEVNENQGNMVWDSIIQVVTEENSCLGDRDAILGNSDSDPLKIPIIKSSKDTYKSLLPILKKYQLDDNFVHFIQINEKARIKINELKMDLRIQVLMMVIAGAAVLYLTMQTSTILFERKRQDYAIKRLFGWKRKQVYTKIYLLEFGMTAISVLGSILLNQGEDVIMLLVEAIIITIFDWILLSIYISHLEKKMLLKTLKGGV
ncbi:MAG: DUF1430 domain-containing protein [Anaerostipes sp.]|nr:DUF1430 domain-containing protein [Anaerostipes sp.]MDD3745308.1 DUF1430 domain-containing protein [Anaerostipes sp.]